MGRRNRQVPCLVCDCVLNTRGGVSLNIQTQRRALLMTVPSENKSYFRVLYSPDGSHVACGMSKAEVRILDSTTGAQVKSMTNTSKEFKNSEVVHMDFSPDGKYLAAGYENRHIVIWDVENCEVVHSLVNEDSSSKCHESKITSLRYTPNGRYLWSVEEKGIHKTWDAQSNYQCLAKGTCLAKWYDDDEGDKLEGEIPGGIFTGHYEMEFPEGNSGDASFPIRFWDDGTLSGEGSDKDGDYTIKGTYDLASGTMKLVQEQYIASAEYDLQFEFTPNTEAADGTCHIWGKYVIPTWAGTYKGTIDMTLTEPYPEDPKEEGNLNRARSGDVSGDSRLAVTANDDCTLKIYSLQGKNTAVLWR
ncbi:uncharacterized protein [Porites lutea]|uniref:uncharacterized protein n=1 Tax=Porites lutea TaxID=51062 RepID=UPI003CC5F28B